MRQRIFKSCGAKLQHQSVAAPDHLRRAKVIVRIRAGIAGEISGRFGLCGPLLADQAAGRCADRGKGCGIGRCPVALDPAELHEVHEFGRKRLGQSGRRGIGQHHDCDARRRQDDEVGSRTQCERAGMAEAHAARGCHPDIEPVAVEARPRGEGRGTRRQGLRRHRRQQCLGVDEGAAFDHAALRQHGEPARQIGDR